jgi:uncharacterized PurR-regulated membrane protein YhhQ (DUF165 family)
MNETVADVVEKVDSGAAISVMMSILNWLIQKPWRIGVIIGGIVILTLLILLIVHHYQDNVQRVLIYCGLILIIIFLIIIGYIWFCNRYTSGQYFF